MRPCLRQQRTTLGPHRLSSRFLPTTGTRISWRLAVKEKDASVNALVYVVPDDPTPGSRRQLNGMTVAIRDNICAKNMPTTCSSAMLPSKSILTSSLDARILTDPLHDLIAEDFQSPFDATVVYLLNASRATIIAKTNCDEFDIG